MMPADTARLRRARQAFRAARHGLAAAVLANDDAATVAACWRLLRAYDRLGIAARNPTARDDRTAARWRGFALAAVHNRIPAGLAARARRLDASNRGRAPNEELHNDGQQRRRT